MPNPLVNNGLVGAVLSALSKWNSGVQPLVWPKPSPNKNFPTTLVNIPDLTAADGSVWTMNAASTSLTRTGPTGTVVYTIVPSEINASATRFLYVLPDYTTGRLYMLCDNGSTTLYFGFTTLAAKAITQRGTGVATTLGSAFVFMEKVGLDFQVYSSTIATPTMDFATITEATGAISAATTFRLGGVNVLAGLGTLQLGQYYVSADRTIVADLVSLFAAYDWCLRINRGGGLQYLPLGTTNYGNFSSTVASQQCLGAVVNGDQVVLMPTATASVTSNLPRFYNRAEFDAFLQRAADYMGLPR